MGFEVAGIDSDGNQIHVFLGQARVGEFVQSIVDAGADQIAIRKINISTPDLTEPQKALVQAIANYEHTDLARLRP